MHDLFHNIEEIIDFVDKIDTFVPVDVVLLMILIVSLF